MKLKPAISGLLLSMLLSIASLQSRGQSYYFAFDYQQYTEMQGHYLILNDPFDDTLFTNVPIGFNYRFAGRSWNELHISSNGQIFFGDDPSHFDTLFTMLPFGADLYGDVMNHIPSISYDFGGCAGAFMMKIQFSDCSMKGGSDNDYVNFQIWLYESNGAFEFHYGPSHVDNISNCFDGNGGPRIGSLSQVNSSGQVLSSLFLNGFPFAPDTTSAGQSVYLDGLPEDGQFYYFEPLFTTGSAEDPESQSRPYLIRNQDGNSTLFINPASSGKVNISLTDASGREFLRMDKPVSVGMNEIGIRTDNLAPGIYVIRVLGGVDTRIVRFVVL
ncbi:MAG: T9SS type A sorting domain-containing protein [Bacteroidales bacterium]|nr:T9SS type A sorting domain-containing protein [Bacteroidales bacterium]